MTNHGFDLTHFGEQWPALEAMLGLRYVGRAKHGFEWATDDGLVMVTGNNPTTGEYGPGRDKRDDEVGFASYIGLTGPETEVEKAAALIRQYADFIKDETPGRRTFI